MEQDIFIQLGIALQNLCLKLSKDQSLAKLLIVMDETPLSHIDLDLDGEDSIFEQNIKTTPYIDEQEAKKGILVIMPIYGTVDNNNDEFGVLSLDISMFLPIDKWNVNEQCQRPYLIMSRIKKIIDRKKITGIGTIKFEDFQLYNLSDEISQHKIHFTVEAIS